MLKFFILFFSILWSTQCTQDKQSLNILVSCDLSTKSHVKSIFEIGENLTNLGHKITFASFETNGHYTKGYNISNVLFEGGPKGEFNFETIFTDMEIIDAKKANELFTSRYQKMIVYAYGMLFPNLEKLVKDNHYDLMICDFISSACQDIAQKYSIPLIIGFQTLDALVDYYPKFKIQTLHYSKLTVEKMSFFERYNHKVLQQIHIIAQFSKYFKALNDLKDSFNVKKSSSLFGNLKYGFGLANTFVGFEIAQDLPQNVQLIGPIMSKNNQKLTKEIEDFLITHPRTIYIAFGSAVIIDPTTMSSILQSISIAIDNNIIDGAIWGLGNTEQTLKKLPDTIEYTQSTINVAQLIQNKHPNIRLLNWAPQQALLNHHNVKLFISHGGIESTFESAHSKTPILCIPVIGDQPRNAAKIENMGIGKYLPFDNLLKGHEHMINSIKEIVEDIDGSYNMNLNRIYKMTEGTELRKELATKLIEDYVYTAKLCRKYKPYDPQGDGPPCELEPLLPPTWKIDFNRLHSVDIIIVNLLLMSLILFLTYYFIKHITFIIYNKLVLGVEKNKKKIN